MIEQTAERDIVAAVNDVQLIYDKTPSEIVELLEMVIEKVRPDPKANKEYDCAKRLAVEDKLYGYTSKKGLIPKAEPSLSLLIVDFGDCCVVRVEKGETPKDFIVGMQETRTKDVYIVSVPFTGFQSVKDEIDRVNIPKPVPRIERDNGDGKGSYVLYEDKDTTEYLASDTYNALNELARAAGATKDLPIYEPKSGTWTQIYPSQAYGVSEEFVEVVENSLLLPPPCKIYRYEC